MACGPTMSCKGAVGTMVPRPKESGRRVYGVVIRVGGGVKVLKVARGWRSFPPRKEGGGSKGACEEDCEYGR